MKKETYEKQKAFAGAKKPSMLRRCLDHDYTDRQIYMLTLTTEGRRPLFGQVKGDPQAPKGSANSAHIELSELGEAVRQNWFAIPRHYPKMKVLALQMMPDHLHGILFVTEKMDKPLGQAIAGFKAGCNKAYRELLLHQPVQYVAAVPQQTQQAVPQQTQQAVPQQTQQARPPRSTYDRSHGLLFSPSYNDRLLIRAGQLDTWLNYLDDNPRRLLMKRQHPDLFRVRFGLTIGHQTYSALGNRFLLTYPDRRQVQCSRSLTEGQIQERIDQALAAAQLGAVHVSPAISKGEKAVMRALLNAQCPLIYLEENGLTPYTKPNGEFFEACSRGQLLILAPWGHHNEHLLITRNKCLTLNAMTRQICEGEPHFTGNDPC
jgi:hypothetical protein